MSLGFYKNITRDNMWELQSTKPDDYFYPRYTVQNLPEKIRNDSRDPVTGKRDAIKEAKLLRRFNELMKYLKETYGYKLVLTLSYFSNHPQNIKRTRNIQRTQTPQHLLSLDFTFDIMPRARFIEL